MGLPVRSLEEKLLHQREDSIRDVVEEKFLSLMQQSFVFKNRLAIDVLRGSLIGGICFMALNQSAYLSFGTMGWFLLSFVIAAATAELPREDYNPKSFGMLALGMAMPVFIYYLLGGMLPTFVYGCMVLGLSGYKRTLSHYIRRRQGLERSGRFASPLAVCTVLSIFGVSIFSAGGALLYLPIVLAYVYLMLRLPEIPGGMLAWFSIWVKRSRDLPPLMREAISGPMTARETLKFYNTQVVSLLKTRQEELQKKRSQLLSNRSVLRAQSQAIGQDLFVDQWNQTVKVEKEIQTLEAWFYRKTAGLRGLEQVGVAQEEIPDPEIQDEELQEVFEFLRTELNSAEDYQKALVEIGR